MLDPAELDFPFHQMTLFKGLEQLPDVLADPPRAAAGLSGRVRQVSAAVRKGCRGQQIDYVLMRTDQSLEMALSSYLASRHEPREVKVPMPGFP